MKTAMQELIDDMTYMLTEGGERNICALREKARKLLEKEKEQMRLVHKNGYDNSQYIHDCKYGGVEYWDSVPKPFDEYYNETFNTKER
jgi:ElaB/YqjD/DUF883 family membrane-anchored ribosome-binding protein